MTSQESPLQRRDIEAVFNYVDAKFDRDFLNNENVNGEVGKPMDGFGGVTKPVKETVEDVRGREQEFSLDKNGFMFLNRPLQYDGPLKEYETVKARYWPEVEELIREACPTATEVFVYNTVPRISNGRSPAFKGEYAFAYNQHHDQVYKAHVDQDIEGAVSFVHEYFPKDSTERLRKRFQVINVWRPLKEVQKDPLAVVDLCSIAHEDLASVGGKLPDGRRGAQLALRPVASSRRPRWCYKYRQRPDEVLLFLQFDNSPKMKNWGHVAHSSFVDELAEANGATEARISLEARALVFYDEEGVVPSEELIRWQSPLPGKE